MSDDHGDGDDDGKVVYLSPLIEVRKIKSKGRPAGGEEPKPARAWRPAIAVVVALAFMAAVFFAPWRGLEAVGDVAAGLGVELLVLAFIAGVLILGAALSRKKRPAPRRGLGRILVRTREAPTDMRMELHVWVEFWADHEPTMIEAVEAVLTDLREDERRRSWSGR